MGLSSVVTRLLHRRVHRDQAQQVEAGGLCPSRAALLCETPGSTDESLLFPQCKIGGRKTRCNNRLSHGWTKRVFYETLQRGVTELLTLHRTIPHIHFRCNCLYSHSSQGCQVHFSSGNSSLGSLSSRRSNAETNSNSSS